MRRLILALLAFVLLLPFMARSSSEVTGQTLIDSMVTSNINLRRREYVYKSRPHWRKKKPVRKNVRKRIVRRYRSRG